MSDQSRWAGFDLPDGRTKVIDLMPTEYRTTGREILGIINEDIFIAIDPDLNKSEVYKSGYNSSVGELFSPTDVGLRKFLVAGGIKKLHYESRKEGQRIWVAVYEGEYTLPNGDKQNLPGDYEFDTSVGGPRWLVKKQTEIFNHFRREAGGATDQDWVNLRDEICLDRWLDCTDEQRANIEKRAELRATMFVDQIAQYGRQRANTGSLDRALRKFFLIRSYSKKELAECCFHITRTKVDLELRRIGLGALESKIVEVTELLADKLPLDVVGNVVNLLVEGERMKMHPQSAADAFMDGFPNEADVIEGTVLTPVDPEEQKLFLFPMEKETDGKISRAMIDFYGWGIFNVRVASARCNVFFSKAYREISEGEAQLLLAAYTRLNVIVDHFMPHGTPAGNKMAWREARKEARVSARSELEQSAAHMADIVRKCAHEKRLWKEADEIAEQMELDGMPPAEPADISDPNGDKEGTSSDTADTAAGNDE